MIRWFWWISTVWFSQPIPHNPISHNLILLLTKKNQHLNMRVHSPLPADGLKYVLLSSHPEFLLSSAQPHKSQKVPSRALYKEGSCWVAEIGKLHEWIARRFYVVEYDFSSCSKIVQGEQDEERRLKTAVYSIADGIWTWVRCPGKKMTNIKSLSFCWGFTLCCCCCCNVLLMEANMSNFSVCPPGDRYGSGNEGKF